jgi:uncharacterized protein involved in outer membrane biogenesis
MSDAPRKPKLSRKIKAVLWTAGLLLAYAVAGFLIVPAIIKSQMLKRLPSMTKRQAAVREVAFNPFTFSFAMRGLSLTESNGQAFAGLDGFHLQFQALSSLTRRAWVFRDVTLTHPFARVIRRKDGSFNFDNLLATDAAPSAKPAPPSALPAVVVESLRVDGASLEMDDLTPAAAFHDKLAPVNLQLTDFSTRSNAASAFVFSAATDANEKIAAAGNITIQPLQVLGNVKITGLDLKRYGPYVAAFTTAQLAGGKLDAEVDYQAAIGPRGLDASVSHGTVQLAGLNVTSPDSGETVVSIPMLTLELAGASLGGKTAHVSSIKSSGGSLLVRQRHDGAINLLALLVPQKPSPAAPSSSPAAPWTARVDEIAFEGYSVSVEDQKPARPVKLDVTALAFTVKGFDSATNSPLTTAVAMRLNGQGSLSVNGTVALAPVSGDLALDLAGLDLPAFAPYVPDQFRIVLAKGQLNVKGRAQCSITPGGPAGSFAGDVSLKNFATSDAVYGEDLIKFDDLAVNGIKAAYPQVKLQIEEVALTGFNVNVVVETNHQINLLTVVSNNPAGQPATPAPAGASAAAPLPPVDLGALVINKASLHFVDESLEPHATLEVEELSGTIKDLSTHSQKPASLELRGSMNQLSAYAISGSAAPLAKDLSLNLTVSVKNMDLTPLTPYMEKYAGHPLNKGKLALQLKYDIAGRKLGGSNIIVIADLTLGPRNSSTNATHLPVKLGVALLKDRQGKIDLDIPVSGSLDDPNFRIGPAVQHEVENLLGKVASSPFTLLGKVVGAGNEELSSVDFAPGEAALAASEKDKLKKLAKALYERPALTLQIAGACAPKADRAALARKRLQGRINKLRVEELAAAGQPAQGVESIKLNPADNARLLRKLYEQAFGPIATNQPASTPTNAPAAAAAPPAQQAAKPAQAPSLPKRVWLDCVKFVNICVHGVEKLAGHKTAPPPAAVASAPKPAAPVQPPAAGPDAAQMEQRLLEQISVTDDELRELMQARARAAQTALLGSSRIPAERIAILPAKAINAAAQGETRANFALE